MFEAGMAHDLRGPLGVICGELELALQNQLPSIVEDGLRSAANLARNVVNCFEDIVVLDAGHSPEKINLTQVAKDCREKCGLDVNVGELPTVEADRRSSYRTFLNLFCNARDHGVPPIEVSHQDGKILIKDGGPGLPQEYAEALVNDAEIPRHGVRGLGLELARALADCDGWKLTAVDGFPCIELAKRSE